MCTSARPARGSAVAMATVQVEWSASVMRDTMVGHTQHIMFKVLLLIQIFFSIVFSGQRRARSEKQVLFMFSFQPFDPNFYSPIFTTSPLVQVMTAPSQTVTFPAPSRTILSPAVCLRRAGS